MATKITDLSTAGGVPDATDQFLVFDTSANKFVRVVVADFIQTIGLLDDTVATADIAAGAVTSAKVEATAAADGTYTTVSAMTIDQQGRCTAITGTGP